MTNDGGGWTIWLRRLKAGVDFNLTWASYKAGFGGNILSGEEFFILFKYYYKNYKNSYWLGLENLYYMTNDHNSKLRVDMYDPGLSPNTVYGIFNTFKISAETDKYRSLI